MGVGEYEAKEFINGLIAAVPFVDCVTRLPGWAAFRLLAGRIIQEWEIPKVNEY